MEKRNESKVIANHRTGETREELMAKIPIPGPGVKKDTPEKKIEKKAIKKIIEEYTQKLAESLPGISPVLIKKAKGGDIMAIKELHDRVMGKPPQKTTIDGELKLPQPILGGKTNVSTNDSSK